jgi:hypothetical protein
MLGVFYAVV